MIDYSEPFQHFVCSHDPLVSVVIPSYRKALHLKGCVESFVAQTYRNLEILVVNDGSPDTTSEVDAPADAAVPAGRYQTD